MTTNEYTYFDSRLKSEVNVAHSNIGKTRALVTETLAIINSTGGKVVVFNSENPLGFIHGMNEGQRQNVVVCEFPEYTVDDIMEFVREGFNGVIITNSKCVQDFRGKPKQVIKGTFENIVKNYDVKIVVVEQLPRDYEKEKEV